MRHTWILLISAGAMALGCAKGRTPPSPTSMIVIPTAASGQVEYTFGTEAMCLDSEEDDFCSQKKPPRVYPTMQVEVDSFEIDEHEVTNLQYQHCVARGACSEPGAVNALGGGAYEKYYSDKDGRFNDFPVVNVTWLQANEYCGFVGKRLPSEFEWEAAARATTQDDKPRFPWGSSLEACDGQDVAVAGCNSKFGFAQPAIGSMVDDVILIGGRELHGMGGNVSEWVSNNFEEDVTCSSPMTGLDCASAYDECSEETGTDFQNCADAFETCVPCIEQDNDGNDVVSGKCFAQCFGRTPDKTLWVCQRRDVAFDPDKDADGGSGGGLHAYRGGNYITQNTCEARPGDRLDKTLASSKSSPTIGIRCARSL